MLQTCLAGLLLLNVLHTVVSTYNFKFSDLNVVTTKTLAIWENATVPFYINPAHFDHEQSTAILTALSMFAFKTCIKFRPVMARPFPTDEVMVFVNPDGTRRCQIDVKGHSVFNPHLVKLGYECLQSPQVDMMVMRALGFPFEHNRSDRDLYIHVLQENIEPGAIELFAIDDTLPIELGFLPYDVNSVMHFSNREYSKNGHRTILFKDPTIKQNRVGLTDNDIRKIEMVYGPECRARDRHEKLELCQSYPGVARKKRELRNQQKQTLESIKRRKRDAAIDDSVIKSLRVNPDITPPPEIRSDDVTATLQELGIDDEVQDIVDQIFKVSSLALKNTREKYCNKSDVTPLIVVKNKHENATRNSDMLEIIEVIGGFAKNLVDDALKNLTRFCDDPEAIHISRQSGCVGYGRDPRCRETYRSTKSGAVHYSTNHRPVIPQSTNHYGGEKKRIQYAREGNQTEEGESTVPTIVSVRRKRESKLAATNPAEKSEIDQKEGAEVKAEVEKTDEKPSLEMEKTEGLEAEKEMEKEMKKDTPEVKKHHSEQKAENNNENAQKKERTLDTDDIKAKSEENSKIDNKDPLRKGTMRPSHKGLEWKRRSQGHHRVKNYDKSSEDLDNLDSILAKKIVEEKHDLLTHKRYPKNKDLEETRHKIREKTQRHKTVEQKMHSPGVYNTDSALSDREELIKHVKANNEQRKPLGKKKIYYDESIDERIPSTESENDEKETEIISSPSRSKPLKQKSNRQEFGLPKTVPLSKKNDEFYKERRWPGGVVTYMIQVDTTYDLEDMRRRLAEVNDILKERTCVRLKEIKPGETNKYEDYLVIDNSPDYVTGRVGGKQKFGSIELFRGGQHRQHAAMMVMAMLGFYFEVSRHDRDKFIRVHMRHVRPDKLHHFELIRSDATLPLPYDYESATHPAWQFWRQIGRTGISTVATYKQMDSDGSIMKSLGQHEKLLSDIDIVKINSVYGIECFKKSQRSTLRKPKKNNRN